VQEKMFQGQEEMQIMSNWIPTAERLPTGDMSRIVFVQNSTDSFRRNLYASYVNKEDHVAWMELPEPYVPPQPKRQRWTKSAGWSHDMIEVLPGDPDPDAYLELLRAASDVVKFHTDAANTCPGEPYDPIANPSQFITEIVALAYAIEASRSK
jgi:hypothetical protein